MGRSFEREIEELEVFIEKNEPGLLDEVVHDACAYQARALCAQGTTAQIRYLVETLGVQRATLMLKRMLRERVDRG